MTAAERGVLLLCSQLDADGPQPLTMAQFRELSKRAHAVGMGGDDPLRELTPSDIRTLGYDAAEADRIAALLGREAQLDRLLSLCESRGITPLARISDAYPARLCRVLGLSCPPVLFAVGNAALLSARCISLVGSRELSADGRRFAEKVGALCAAEGYTLCSGGAVGADRAAQDACLAAGGNVLVFTAEPLFQKQGDEHIVYVAEGGISLPFSAARAMSRNRLIHAMGEKTLVAQTGFGAGGTWNGTLDNLRHGYSPVFLRDDGSAGAAALIARGACPVSDVDSLSALTPPQTQFQI